MKKTKDDPEPDAKITVQEHLARVSYEVQRELGERIVADPTNRYEVFHGLVGFALLLQNEQVSFKSFKNERTKVFVDADTLARGGKDASMLVGRYRLWAPPPEDRKTEDRGWIEIERAFADPETLLSFKDEKRDLKSFDSFKSQVVSRAMNKVLTAVNSHLDLSGFEAKVERPRKLDDTFEEDDIPFFLRYSKKQDLIYPLDKALRCKTPRKRKRENNVSKRDLDTIAYMADHGIALVSDNGLGHDELGKATACFTRWHRMNRWSLEFVTTELGERIGFTCVLPITKRTFDLYRSGRLSEWSISKKHVNPIKQLGEQRYLLIQSITLSDERGKKIYANADREGLAWRFRSALFHTLVRQMARLLPKKQVPVLIADAPERNGRIDELLLETGFNKVKGGPDERYIYWVDLSDKSVNPKVVPRRNRLLRLLRAYWKLRASDPDELK